jgi:hypothetical protein
MKKTITSQACKTGSNANCHIIYHPKLKRLFAKWAVACRVPPEKLRMLTEVTIRRRHHKAERSKWFSFREEERASAPFELKLWRAPRVYVYFLPENGSFVVRGYGWDFYDEIGEQISHKRFGVGQYYKTPIA